MLLAQAARAGAMPRTLGIARDTADSLRRPDRAKGCRPTCWSCPAASRRASSTWCPGVLAELGVQTFFHKVAMKPGKPMLFGVKQHDEAAADAGLRPARQSGQLAGVLRAVRAAGAARADGAAIPARDGPGDA